MQAYVLNEADLATVQAQNAAHVNVAMIPCSCTDHDFAIVYDDLISPTYADWLTALSPLDPARIVEATPPEDPFI